MAECRFLLGFEERSLDEIDPTTTVLDYLRGAERRSGTKEGCAEGDCGACTVVVAQPDGNGGLDYHAVNSCIQFVPTLHGKQLITVEDLSGADGQGLHGAQQAMVDADGSQCGFCTPGFVMSLFAAQKSQGLGDARSVCDTLAGNLCRCTGYGPILKAARALAGQTGKDRFDTEAANTAKLLEAMGAPHGNDKTPDFFAPLSITELDRLVAEYPDARIIAGLTDVGLWVTKAQMRLPQLISISRVKDLAQVTVAASQTTLGAGVTLSEARRPLAAIAPDLGEIVRRFASTQIRNAATVGGNIANGSPIGDLAPAFIALGAMLVLRRAGRQRTIPLEDFFIAYGRQDRREGEYVEAVMVPHLPRGCEFRAYKIAKRFDQDISAVLGAFAVQINDGKVASARLGFGGMAGTPARAPRAEAALEGQPWGEAAIRAAMAVLEADFTPLTDMRASAKYRMQVAKNLLLKFWLETGALQYEPASGKPKPAPATRVWEVAGG